MTPASNRRNPRFFFATWLRVAGVLGAVVVLLGLIAAPMILPVLFGDTWWAFALMGIAYFLVASFITAFVGVLA